MATCKDCLFKCYTEDLEDVEVTCNFYLDNRKYVEVVRCKDCKWSEDYRGVILCNSPCGIFNKVKEDSFCSFGERREGE